MPDSDAGFPLKGPTLVAAGVFLLAIAAVATVLLKEGLGPTLVLIATWRSAAAAPFVLIYVIAALILVPDSLLTLAAGAMFGLGRGLALVSLGSTLGAAAAFLVGRRFAHEWVRSRTGHWRKFHALDRAIVRHGFWIVFLTRLSPVFPYGVLNYAYSVTTVRPRDYLLASWIGMLPGSLLYVYAGSVAMNITQVMRGGTPIARQSNLLLWIGLGTTVVVIGLVTHLARRELMRQIRS